MSVPKPHYLLFSEVKRGDEQGGWSFSLKAADGSATFEAGDIEPDVHGERLELLAVVRGLEALDQPSRVTLVTPSRYVNLGLAYGLEEWRRNGWTWECFGQMVPIKNRDLWQRLDRALHYHQLDRKILRFDRAHMMPGRSLSEKLGGIEFADTSAVVQPVASASQRRPAPVATRRRTWRGLRVRILRRIQLVYERIGMLLGMGGLGRAPWLG